VVQARVQRNSARILDAAVRLAAAGGWAALSFANVGQTAGLTIRPVRDRYPDRARLGADTWSEVAGPALVDALGQALRTAGLLDQTADEPAFAAAMDRRAVPDDRLRAAAELVVISCFESQVRDAVEATLVPVTRDWLQGDQGRGVDRGPNAARRGYLLALALGLLATANRPGIPTLDLRTQWDRLLAAFATRLEPARLPDEPRPAFLEHIPFDTGDALTDDLLRLAIDHLGRRGYEGSYLADIASECGVTEATIYLRYPTKEAFLMDAINRQQDITIPGQRAYLTRLEQTHGVGIAEAVAIRDTMHPRERLINIIEIERARLTWHRPNLAAADEDRLQRLRQEVLQVDPGNRDFADPARLHFGRAVGLGITLLPLVDDRAWDQPYDVVTTPMSQT
jgi:AcrR family transcriptional regulator